MARVTYVKKAQKAKGERRCTRCRKTIEVGDSYKWFANRIGRMSVRKNFCSDCQIRQSDMTTSANLQQLYQAIENAEDQASGLSAENTLDDFALVLRDCAEEVRTVGEQYGESADNMEEGFGHETYQSQEIREKAESLESFADELESAADDIESLEDPSEDEDVFDLSELDADEEDEDFEEKKAEFIADKRDERFEAAQQSIYDALGNCPM